MSVRLLGDAAPAATDTHQVKPHLPPDLKARFVLMALRFKAANGCLPDPWLAKVGPEWDTHPDTLRKWVKAAETAGATTLDEVTKALERKQSTPEMVATDEQILTLFDCSGDITMTHKKLGLTCHRATFSRAVNRRLDSLFVLAGARGGYEALQKLLPWLRYEIPGRNLRNSLDAYVFPVLVRVPGTDLACTPWGVAVIDDYSRLIKALNVTLDKPNETTTAETIADSICSELISGGGLTDVEVGGAAAMYAYDNSFEQLSRLIVELLCEIEATSNPLPEYAKTANGKMERFWGELNRKESRLLYGTTEGAQGFRMDQPFRFQDGTPVFEIDHFIAEVDRWVHWRNTEWTFRATGQTSLRMWADDGEPLRFPDEAALDRCRLPDQGTRQVDPKEGVSVAGVYFTHPLLFETYLQRRTVWLRYDEPALREALGGNGEPPIVQVYINEGRTWLCEARRAADLTDGEQDRINVFNDAMIARDAGTRKRAAKVRAERHKESAEEFRADADAKGVTPPAPPDAPPQPDKAPKTAPRRNRRRQSGDEQQPQDAQPSKSPAPAPAAGTEVAAVRRLLDGGDELLDALDAADGGPQTLEPANPALETLTARLQAEAGLGPAAARRAAQAALGGEQ